MPLDLKVVDAVLKRCFGPRQEPVGTYAQLCAVAEASRRSGRSAASEAVRLGVPTVTRDALRETWERKSALFAFFGRGEAPEPYRRQLTTLDVERTQSPGGARR